MSSHEDAPNRWRSALLNGSVFLVSVSVIFLFMAAQGRLAVFFDTIGYYSHGQQIFGLFGAHGHGHGDPGGTGAGPRGGEDRVPVGGRSPYYAVFFYVVWRLGGLVAVAVVQSLLIFAALRLYLDAFSQARPRLMGPVIFWLLCGLTALPFCATFAMPDIFTSIMAICTVVLLFRTEVAGWRAVALVVLAFLSILFHTSNIVIECVFLGGFAVFQAARGNSAGLRRRPFLSLGAALVLAISLGAAFDAAVKFRYGHAPYRPPFLVARVLADGPGRRLLDVRCGLRPTYALCRYRHLPLDVSEDILWGSQAKGNLFMRLPPAERDQISREEFRFVIDAVVHAPVLQLTASLRNVLAEAQMFAPVEEMADPAEAGLDPLRRAQWSEITGSPQACLGARGRCAGSFQPDRVAGVEVAVLVASLLVLCGAGLRALLPGGRTAGVRAWLPGVRPEGWALVAFVLINLVVTAVLSGPFARYNCRMIWLLPFLALVELSDAFFRRDAQQSEARHSASSNSK